MSDWFFVHSRVRIVWLVHSVLFRRADLTRRFQMDNSKVRTHDA